jgi:hypothetical protein
MGQYFMKTLNDEIVAWDAAPESGFISPINGVMGSGFNDTRDGGNRIHHSGDIKAPPGTEFVAPMALKITEVRDQMSDAAGGMVWGTDEQGRLHKFIHVVPGVKKDDVVNPGQPLGVLSNIKGSHLHYQIKDQNDNPVDWTKHFKRGDAFQVPSSMVAGPATPSGVRDTSPLKQGVISKAMPEEVQWDEDVKWDEPVAAQPRQPNLLQNELNAGDPLAALGGGLPKQSGIDLLTPVAKATEAAISLPGKIAAPFVNKAASLIPESSVYPSEVMADVAAGITPRSLSEGATLPGREVARVAGQVGAETYLFNKLFKLLEGQSALSRLRPTGTTTPTTAEPTLDLLPAQAELRSSSGSQAVSQLSAENAEIQRIYDQLHGLSKSPFSNQIMGAAAKENQALIDQLSGSTSRVLPGALEGTRPVNIPAITNPQGLQTAEEIQRFANRSFPNVPLAEKLTPTATEKIVGAQQRSLQETINATPLDTTEFTKNALDRKLLKEYYGGGTKLYGGLPVDKFIEEETLRKGVSSTLAISNAVKKFGISPEEGVAIVKRLKNSPVAPATMEGLAAETPVYHQTFKTNIDSNLGPAGTEVKTIPLTVEDLAVRNLAEVGKDISKPFIAQHKWGNTLKTNERLFSEIDDVLPGFYNRIYHPLKEAENIAHGNTIKFFDEMDALKGTLPKGAGNNIGIDAIAQRGNGAVRLKSMGITPKALSSAEQQASAQIKKIYDETWAKLNEGRALAGSQPIPYDENYMPFMVNFVEKVSEGTDPIKAAAYLFNAPTETPFRFKFKLTNTNREVATDAFDVIKNYVAMAERHVNISPQLKRIEMFQDGIELATGTKLKPLGEIAPNINTALNHMREAISGVKEPMTPALRWLTKLSDNLVISTLGAYPRSVVNQMGSLAAGSAETGISNMVKGLSEMLTPGKWEEAHRLSNVLSQRVMDVVLEDLWGSGLSKMSAKAKHYAMMPLEVVDNFMATATWRGAMNRAEQLGLKGKDAVQFADSTVIRTQASASSIDRAMAQGTVTGRVATAFQTFAIADANYISRYVLGRGNINFNKMDGLKKLATMTLVGTGLNYLQREIIGMPAGLPEPITKYMEATEMGAGPIEAGVKAAAEFAPFVPIAGSIAFGKMPGGAIGSTAGDLIMGRKSPLEALAMLSGIPGMNIIQKGLKTEEGVDFVRGIKSDLNYPQAPRKGKPYTWGEVLLGREPELKRHKQWNVDKWMER